MASDLSSVSLFSFSFPCLSLHGKVKQLPKVANSD